MWASAPDTDARSGPKLSAQLFVTHPLMSSDPPAHPPGCNQERQNFITKQMVFIWLEMVFIKQKVVFIWFKMVSIKRKVVVIWLKMVFIKRRMVLILLKTVFIKRKVVFIWLKLFSSNEKCFHHWKMCASPKHWFSSDQKWFH